MRDEDLTAGLAGAAAATITWGLALAGALSPAAADAFVAGAADATAAVLTWLGCAR